MTTDALGPCPPRYEVIERLDCWPEDWPAWAVDVIEREREIAEWWKRRAERAEALLKAVTPRMDRHDYACSSEHGLYRKRCDCGLLNLRARVAAHFDSINSKGDDKCRTE